MDLGLYSDGLFREAIEAEIAARVQYIHDERAFLKQQVTALEAERNRLKYRLERTEDEVSQERSSRQKLETFCKTNSPEYLPLSDEVKRLNKQLTQAEMDVATARKDVLFAWSVNEKLGQELQVAKAAQAKAESEITEEALALLVNKRLSDDRKEMEGSLARAFRMIQHETDRAEMYRRQVDFFVQYERSWKNLPTPENPLQLALMRIENLDSSIGKISPNHATWLRRYGQTTDLNEPVIPDLPREWLSSAMQTDPNLPEVTSGEVPNATKWFLFRSRTQEYDQQSNKIIYSRAGVSMWAASSWLSREKSFPRKARSRGKRPAHHMLTQIRRREISRPTRQGSRMTVIPSR